MIAKVALQGAVETIQKHDSGAAVVDSYKAMFKRMASERNALVERNVVLEYQNQSLQSRVDALKSKEPANTLQQLVDTPQVRFSDNKSRANAVILAQYARGEHKGVAPVTESKAASISSVLH